MEQNIKTTYRVPDSPEARMNQLKNSIQSILTETDDPLFGGDDPILTVDEMQNSTLQF